MASQYPTQYSNLRSGLLPPSYGAFLSNNGASSNGLNQSPPPYCPVPAPIRPPGIRPPGLAHVLPPAFIPHFTNRLAKGKLSMGIGRGLAICFAIMISLQVALAIRASKERSALAAERENSEQERERMRRDMELWEKAREDRVPHDAFWDVISPALDCLAYDKREYSAMLQNVPEGWTAVDACMSKPVEIEGVTIRRPYRCAFVDGSPHIHGYWMVDWEQLDCRPWYRDFHDVGCTNYGSGKRRIEAQIVGIPSRKEQDWWLLCNSTPLVWNQTTYTSPTHCESRKWGRKVAMWDMPDDSCL